MTDTIKITKKDKADFKLADKVSDKATKKLLKAHDPSLALFAHWSNMTDALIVNGWTLDELRTEIELVAERMSEEVCTDEDCPQHGKPASVH
jgi:hypothetical protein